MLVRRTLETADDFEICVAQSLEPATAWVATHLLSYKTCLDTKPVLYQGRFCSLTPAHPELYDMSC